MSAAGIVCPVLPVGIKLSEMGRSISARPEELCWLDLLEERPAGSVCADI